MPVRHFLCRDYLHILCYIKFLIFVSLFHQIRIYIKVMIPSIINTAAQAPIATTIRLFLWEASITATTSPAIAEIKLPVAVKIAGIVMAANTVYGI